MSHNIARSVLWAHSKSILLFGVMDLNGHTIVIKITQTAFASSKKMIQWNYCSMIASWIMELENCVWTNIYGLENGFTAQEHKKQLP